MLPRSNPRTDGSRHINAPIERGRAVSADGTEIAYYVVGNGPVTWVMPPGMGAPLVSLKYLLDGFARTHTIVTWDQRGFFDSDAPHDPDAFRVADHVADMEAVVRAEGLRRFVLGGWSMAVQISLEYHHRHPEQALALVLINGPFERALASMVPFPGTERALIAFLRVTAASSHIVNPLARRLLGARGLASVLERTGFIAQNSQFFAHLLADFSTVHWGRYLTMARHLNAHSAAAYLPLIRVPTLITSGTRDLVTSGESAERLHAGIRGSELYVVPRATHYIVTEFPELLIERIALFLSRAGAG